MTNTLPSQSLTQLAAAFGISTDYIDWKGRHTVVSAASLRAVLAALGIDASTDEAAAEALEEKRLEPWRRTLPPSVVGIQGDRTEFNVHVPAGHAVTVWVELEKGGRREAVQIDNWEDDREIDGERVGEASFAAPNDLPLGYHRLLAECDGETSEATLIITPQFLGFPESMADHRVWGLATQLYSVRSKKSWGIGDLGDLTDLAVWSATEHDAGYVLVNPMHAAEPDLPMEPSPYLPVSRRFFNPIYLRVERIEEYAYADEKLRKQIGKLLKRLTGKVSQLDTIERNAVWAAKETALRLLFESKLSAGRQIAFEAFCRGEGQGLTDFATWCALSRALGRDWKQWPAEYQSPTSPAVARFRAENQAEVDFHRWLQWCLDEQFRDAQAAAKAAGMELGIVHDLAVGVNPSGADTWSLGDAFAHGIGVGAPPDQFTQLGQDWGQPPLRPDRLAELAYQPLRDMVSTILHHSGGIRVDHILGLFRLWWVPAGMKPTEGTYVRYDHHAMVGIVALEAKRAGALVVGEDLGTVEPWVRDYLKSRGVLGTSILWFEQNWDVPCPLPPEQWREYCLASVTTHDLPPTAGYLAGEHVRLRHRLGLLTDSLEDEMKHDREDQARWIDTLQQTGLLAAEDVLNEAAVVRALHQYLIATPSRMLNASLTDAVGDRRTQNQPGTTNEYPNWRVPLTGPAGEPLLLEDVFTSKRARDLCTMMREGTRA